jgi:hypothetical protein
MKSSVDLIPREVRAEQTVHKRILGWIAVGVAVVVAVLLVASSLWVRLGKLDAQVRPLRERVAAMEGWDQKMAPLADRLQSARQRQKIVGRLLKEPFWSGLLSDLSVAAGEKLLLGQVTITKELVNKEPVANKEPDAKDKLQSEIYKVLISGIAPSNGELMSFMTQLGSSKNIKSISLEQSRVSQEKEKQGMVTFEIHGVAE